MTTHILNARQEEAQAQDSINWNDRYLNAYPEDAPVLEAIRAYNPPTIRKFTKEECDNMRKHYERCGHKRTTCKKFDVSISELNRAIKNV